MASWKAWIAPIVLWTSNRCAPMLFNVVARCNGSIFCRLVSFNLALMYANVAFVVLVVVVVVVMVGVWFFWYIYIYIRMCVFGLSEVGMWESRIWFAVRSELLGFVPWFFLGGRCGHPTVRWIIHRMTGSRNVCIFGPVLFRVPHPKILLRATIV